MKLRPFPLLVVACSLLLQVHGWGQRGQGLASSKVDPRLRNAPAQSLLPVFITLVNQPQPEIQRQVEQGYASRKAFAEDRYGRTARLQFLLPGELESAAGELDSVTLEIRETAAREMAAAVQWEQNLMETSLRSLGAVNIQRFTIVNLLSADVPGSSLPALESDPAIAKISLAERRHSHLNISVPSIGAPAFWMNSTSYSGVGQSIAIVDTGIFGAHPAFGARVPVANTKNTISMSVPCANASDNTDTVDRFGHGTHVAGIAAAGQFSGESTLYLGVAKDASNIYMVKAGCTLTGNPSSATFSDSDIIAGLQWILIHTPAKIINMSLGGAVAAQDDDFLASTIDQLARGSDLTFSISAGNDGPGASTMDSPGIAYNVLTVAAVDDQGTPDRSDDVIAGFSSRGPTPGGRKKPDIAAPGDALSQGIFSADNNSTGFVRKRGTSMAAPHIAGSAALLRQAGVTSSLAIKALLINSAGTAAWNPATGWGYVNLNAALGQVSDTLNGSVATGAFRLYSGPSGPFTTTLVWDRNPSSALTNLDLSLYDRSGGALAAVSNSTIDNVEKATASTAGGVVVKVKSISSTGAENFALAGSSSGLAGAAGPILSVSCSGPATLAPNAVGTFGCTVQNAGDLEAFGVNSTLALSGGSGTTMALGTIGPNGSASRNWNVTAPATSGQYTLQNSVASTSFEEAFTASGSVNFTVTQAGGNLPPSNVSVTPSFGNGSSQTFSFVFSDPNGYTDLSTTYMLINSVLNWPGSCYTFYDRNLNVLWLLNDAGNFLLGPVTPTSAATVQNSQCTLSGAGSSVSGLGNNLTVNVALTFKGAFGGAKNMYLNTQNSGGLWSNWKQLGSWTMPAGGNLPPSNFSVTPSSGTGSSQTFSFVFSDPNGYTDLSTTYMLINSVLNWPGSCYTFYNRSANVLWLLNDAGNFLQGPVTPGSATTVQNSQCVLNGAGSTVSALGNNLTVNVALTFKAAFGGAKNVYLNAQDSGGLWSNWQPLGSWTVPAAGNLPPANVSVTPSSGSGLSQTFSFAFSDPNGYTDLSTTYMLINSVLNWPGSCYTFYDRNANVLWLLNDAGNFLLGPVTPGNGTTVQNSQCTLNGAGSTVSGLGNNLTVNVALTFKGAFGGAKNVYLNALDGGGLWSNWQQLGSWTAQ